MRWRGRPWRCRKSSRCTNGGGCGGSKVLHIAPPGEVTWTWPIAGFWRKREHAAASNRTLVFECQRLTSAPNGLARIASSISPTGRGLGRSRSLPSRGGCLGVRQRLTFLIYRSGSASQARSRRCGSDEPMPCRLVERLGIRQRLTFRHLPVPSASQLFPGEAAWETMQPFAIALG